MTHLKRISEIFGKNNHVSFEVFPPKTAQGLRQIYQTIARLSRLNPDFFSVTYGAGGSTAEKSLEIASAITNLAQVTCVAHFTCVGMDQDQVLELLNKLEGQGIQNVLALRGDPPQGQEKFERPRNGFGYANELVAYIRRKKPELGILVAGNPEGHMENPDKNNDFQRQVTKVQAGADGIVTQAFFDNHYLLTYRDKLIQAGVTQPLICGIFPLSNAKQAKRIFELSGSSSPRDLLEKIEKYQNDPLSMEKAGTEFATRQVEELLNAGVNAFHFYTMNRSKQTLDILNNLQTHFPRLQFD